MFFETILVADRLMPLWGFHLERMMRTAAHFEIVLQNNYKAILTEFIANTNMEYGVIKLTYGNQIGSQFSITPRSVPVDFKPSLIIYPKAKQITGWSNFKLVARNFYEYAIEFCHQKGFDDAIILDSEGFVCETTIGNIWVKKEGVLYTPTLKTGCVAGVKRASLLQSKGYIGTPTKEANFKLPDIAGCQLFVSNAIRGIYPIKIAD